MVSLSKLRSVLVAVVALQLATVHAFFPISQERYVDNASSFKVDLENSQYASTLSGSHSVGQDHQVSMASAELDAAGQNGLAEVAVRPGMSILSTDANTQAYFVNVTIGDEIYPLVIDSGSAYLWVYGDACKSASCSNKKLFSVKDVEKATDSSTFSLAYASGVASGYVYEDRIIVNKLATTQNFTFGVADEVPDIFVDYPVSGIFGLPSNNSNNIESIISVLSDSNAISQEKFSMIIGSVNAHDNRTTLNPETEVSLTENKGIFIIGDLEKDLYTGDVYYTPLLSNENHYWQLQIDNVFVNDVNVVFSNQENLTGSDSHTIRTGIVDCGTTLLILPKKDALDLHTYFPSSVSDGTNFAILCNSTEQITLELGHQKWSVSPDAYLGEAYSNDSGFFGYCVSNIQGLDLDRSWILGDVFLHDKYAVFDVQNQQFGLAKKNNDAVLVPYDDSNYSNATTVTSSEGRSTSYISSGISTSTSTSTSSTSKGLGSSLRPGSLFSFSLLSLVLSAF